MRIRWLMWLVVLLVWTWAVLLPNPDAWARAFLLRDGPDTEAEPSWRGHLFIVVQSFLFSKTLHVTAYAVLTILSAFLRLASPHCWLMLAFMSLHGMGTEFVQSFEPMRHASWRDVGL